MTKSYASGDYEYTGKLYYSATKISYYLLFTLSLPLLLEISFVLHIWLGDKVPENTDIFTRLVFITSFISAFANPTSCIVQATGNIKWFSIIVGLGNVLILPVAWIFLELGYGPVSTLIISFIITALIQFARVVILSKVSVFSLADYIKNVGGPSFLFSIIAPIIPIIIHVSMPNGFIRFFIVFSISVITCAVSAWVVGLSQFEKAFIRTKMNYVMIRIKQH